MHTEPCLRLSTKSSSFSTGLRLILTCHTLHPQTSKQTTSLEQAKYTQISAVWLPEACTTVGCADRKPGQRT